MMRPTVIFLVAITLSGCMPTMPIVEQLQQTIAVKGYPIIVDVAVTQAQQQQGLSGRSLLADGTGMLFPYAKPTTQTFWMKDMLFDIDIIWIVDDHVVGIESDVVADDGMRLYPSPVPVDAVLELPAGWANRYRLQIGDEIR